jgi:hypothetical protein
MHGSSYDGDCAAVLNAMAEVYERRYGCTTGEPAAQPLPGHDQPVVVSA